MSPSAGLMLLNEIVPLIDSAVGRGAVRPVGCEDAKELQAEGRALAAAMLHASGILPGAGTVTTVVAILASAFAAAGYGDSRAKLKGQ